MQSGVRRTPSYVAASDVDVYFGGSGAMGSSGEQKMDVEWFVGPPTYEPAPGAYGDWYRDIALIKFTRPVDIAGVWPIEMNDDAANDQPGTTLTVAGYGGTEAGTLARTVR